MKEIAVIAIGLYAVLFLFPWFWDRLRTWKQKRNEIAALNKMWEVHVG